MLYQQLSTQLTDGVLLVQFNRPRKLNAFNKLYFH